MMEGACVARVLRGAGASLVLRRRVAARAQAGNKLAPSGSRSTPRCSGGHGVVATAPTGQWTGASDHNRTAVGKATAPPAGAQCAANDTIEPGRPVSSDMPQTGDGPNTSTALSPPNANEFDMA